MKKTIIAIAVLVSVIALAFYISQNSDLQDTLLPDISNSLEIQADNYYYYQPEDKTYNFIAIKPGFDLDLHVSKSPNRTVAEVGAENDAKVAINASFFRLDNNEAVAIGVLEEDGEKLSKKIVDPSKQLTHVISRTGSDFKLESVAEFDASIIHDLAIQAGPVVVIDNQTMTDQINASVNGRGKYLRTIMGFTEDGELLIFVSRISMRLTEVAANAAEIPYLQDKTYSLLNLDGGSSTSLYVRDLPELSFVENNTVPVLLTVE